MDGIPALLKSLKDALNPGLEPPHTSGDAAHYLSESYPAATSATWNQTRMGTLS